jgi:hypothetical protein
MVSSSARQQAFKTRNMISKKSKEKSKETSKHKSKEKSKEQHKTR